MLSRVRKKEHEQRVLRSTIHNGHVTLVAPRMTVVMDGRRAAVGAGIALRVQRGRLIIMRPRIYLEEKLTKQMTMHIMFISADSGW